MKIIRFRLHPRKNLGVKAGMRKEHFVEHLNSDLSTASLRTVTVSL